jgi:hypothetical protein
MLILPDRSSGTTAEGRSGPAVEVEDLTKVYAGGNAALAGVSFSVDRGETFGFLGPNGSGQTTTVRMQSGLATVTDIDTGMMDKLLTSPIRRTSILLGRVIADAIHAGGAGSEHLRHRRGDGGPARERPPRRTGDSRLRHRVRRGVGRLVEPHRPAHPQLGADHGRRSVPALPALFLTPAFSPKSLLPGWLQTVAAGNAAAYVIETGQRLMSVDNEGPGPSNADRAGGGRDRPRPGRRRRVPSDREVTTIQRREWAWVGTHWGWW